jgi:hypothetical protein
MRRQLLAIRSVVSLVLCVGMGTLLARSFIVHDSLSLERINSYSLSSSNGVISAGRTLCEVQYSQFTLIHGKLVVRPLSQTPEAIADHWQLRWKNDDSFAYQGRWRSFGFGLCRNAMICGSLSTLHWTRSDAIQLPYWMFIAVFAGLPIGRFIRKRRLRLTRAGPPLCRFCCYDLRATPGRCPECGSVPVTTSS